MVGTEKPAGGQQGLPKGRQQQDALSKEAKVYPPRNDGRVAWLQSLEGTWEMDTARPRSPPNRNITEEEFGQTHTSKGYWDHQGHLRASSVRHSCGSFPGLPQTPPTVKGNFGSPQSQITASEMLRPKTVPSPHLAHVIVNGCNA